MAETKEDALKMFKAYFEGGQAIYEYFGVKQFATYDYELQLNDEDWSVKGPHNTSDTVYWQLPELNDEGKYDDYAEACYSGEIRGIYRTEDFTLIFSPSGMGGAGFAHIFDNAKENKEYSQRW